jgi:hypothetical protein
VLLAAVLVGVSAGPSAPLVAAADPPPRYADRWVYASHNLQVDAQADDLIKLIDRSAKAGYTGVVLADFKLSILAHVTRNWFKNAERVKKAAADARLEIIPAVFPIGYSGGLLVHDPNLAAGVPVKDAPFVVKGGQVVPAAAGTGLKNGDFETATGDRFAGVGFQDDPGKSTFADRTVFASGKQSLRMQDAAGNCRVSQRLKLRPWACYRMSAKVRTRDLRDGVFQFLAIGADDRRLVFHDSHLKPTQDWTDLEAVFNTLQNAEVSVYLGVWGGFKGTIWVDDWRLDELGLVNVLRRDACPLTVTSADGKTTFTEGKDFLPLADAKLGETAEGRGNYDFRHAGAEIRITPNSRIKNGDRLLVSWYHPIVVHGEQVACSLNDPKVFELLADQARRVNEVFKPRTWFMGHDEIRVAGWDRLEEGKSPGELLAANARRCVGIIRGINPDARIVVWSDMFDPFHNALDNYYLVNGSLKGSWEGLPKDVVIANWNAGKAAESLKWFADRGHKQVIAGYYDGGLGNFRRWDEAAKGVPGVVGFMYTTWQRKYTHLEEYGKALQGK